MGKAQRGPSSPFMTTDGPWWAESVAGRIQAVGIIQCGNVAFYLA